MDNSTSKATAMVRGANQNFVREVEVLRVIAEFELACRKSDLNAARDQILKWAVPRSGGLPSAAWQGQSFESLVGGRAAMATRVETGVDDIWAIQINDPDKTIPGRIWTTEVSIGQRVGQTAKLGLRLSATTGEEQLEIDPAVPGLVQQLATHFDLRIDGVKLSPLGWLIQSDDDLQSLIALILNPKRRLPVIVASGDSRREEADAPLIDVKVMAKAMLGLAHVVALPAKYTHGLTDEFGKALSVFHGAVRTYFPGFDLDGDAYVHRMVLATTLEVPDQNKHAQRMIKHAAAKDSLRRLRLNHDVLSYSAVRSAAMLADVEKRRVVGTTDSDLVKIAEDEIEVLKQKLARAELMQQQFSDEHEAAEQRALTLEASLAAASSRIDRLNSALIAAEVDIDALEPLPTAWSDFAAWCASALAGRVVLAPAARRSVRNPDYEDVNVAAKCLLWLAGECRNRRMKGGGSLAEEFILDGIRNANCGGDSYSFVFGERKLQADWHVKAGGNTHDPSRCLRIYYCWDEQSQMIVISDMPAHRTTSAS